MSAVLEVRGLSVSVPGAPGERTVVRDVGFRLRPGETLAVVGESGSGKTMTALALLGLLPDGARIHGGASIRIQGREVGPEAIRGMVGLRGGVVGLVSQDGSAALNPVRRVGDQIREVLRTHGTAGERGEGARTLDLLEEVGLRDPERVGAAFPHQLSGGMQQRALIAVALAGQPRVLVADEPTSALDAPIRLEVLDLLARLGRTRRIAVLLITHDFSVVRRASDRVVVFHDGRIVEEGPTTAVLAHPRHPRTRDLVEALRFTGGPEAEPSPVSGEGSVDALVEARGLTVRFPTPRGGEVVALDGVDLEVRRGETVGVVGESGSGKTTLGRVLLGLQRREGGSVRYRGRPVGGPEARQPELRRRAQVVFQDPHGSLNPRSTVGGALEEVLRVVRARDRASARARALELLERVGLSRDVATALPHALSGGQRQRVGIARALAVEPEFLVLDEPVSALDVSVQARILELLLELRATMGLTYLFISHDLAVVRRMSDRIVVLREGRIVEAGPASEIVRRPSHPYTRALVSAAFHEPGRPPVTHPGTGGEAPSTGA